MFSLFTNKQKENIMTFKEILDKCDQLQPFEKRKREDNYYEIVFENQDAKRWSNVLIDCFDRPAKPAGKNPSAEDEALTAPYGGIWNAQTLYRKKFDFGMVITMLWPWDDKVHTTLKMTLIAK